jgi:hypothetical protein
VSVVGPLSLALPCVFRAAEDAASATPNRAGPLVL